MTRTIYEDDDFTLTQFWDGDELEVQVNCIQGGVCFISLTKGMAMMLIEQLTNWVKEV